ncbi:MAG: hypothetical protein Ct9H300mP13_8570 [Gammaproteobacteria bacterium]|nr:MAG: hypothetical protein Ct9H300mP13_8570 [Gammaproteobacteria bacterium]
MAFDGPALVNVQLHHAAGKKPQQLTGTPEQEQATLMNETTKNLPALSGIKLSISRSSSPGDPSRGRWHGSVPT